MLSLWRNWIARSTSNRKVAGSSPARDILFFFFIIMYMNNLKIIKNYYEDDNIISNMLNENFFGKNT